MNTKSYMKIALNIVLGLIFAFSLLTVVTTLNTTEGIPNIFGRGYLTVQSDSMEPVFKAGDLIFVRTTSATDEFEVDDIVTFRTIIGGQQALNTHRIIAYATLSGVRYYTTQGDNVGQSDLATITAGDIVAKYTGHRLIGLGNAIDFIQTKTGFLITVVLPLAALFVYQVINFAILVASLKQKGELSAVNLDVNTLTEEQKEKIAKQYLESLNSKKD